jgi:hypothetical protein
MTKQEEWTAFAKIYNAVGEYPSLSHVAVKLGIAYKTVKNKAAIFRQLHESDPSFPDLVNRSNPRPKDIYADTPSGHVIKGVSALLDKDGKEILKWVKTREDDAQKTIDAIRVAIDEMKREIPRALPRAAPLHANAQLLCQYTVTDLHFGMLAWSEETGGANYDLAIAERRLTDWFATAISMSPDAHTAVLSQLGDFLHFDSLTAVTPTSGHILDADSRFQKIVRVVIRTMRRIITMLLEKHAHVHVIMATGNHDTASAAWMRELFHAMYEDEPRLTVENSPDVYYAYEWGKTALFYHHGHKRQLKDVDTVFAGKFREIYGRCPYAYGHIGHLHNDEARDSNLMKIERHRTLAPPDAYAATGGWLSKQDAKIITYHREFGEVYRTTLSPDMLRA